MLVSNSSNYTKDVVVFFDGLYKFVFGNYWDLNLNSKSIKFADYFYTKKELRKEKLLKLNESR